MIQHYKYPPAIQGIEELLHGGCSTS